MAHSLLESVSRPGLARLWLWVRNRGLRLCNQSLPRRPYFAMASDITPAYATQLRTARGLDMRLNVLAFFARPDKNPLYTPDRNGRESAVTWPSPVPSGYLFAMGVNGQWRSILGPYGWRQRFTVARGPLLASRPERPAHGRSSKRPPTGGAPLACRGPQAS